MKNSIFWDVTVPRLMTAYANIVFLLLWVGFFLALIVNRDWLDTAWNWVQGLPDVPKIIIWVVLTPVMTLLWIWQSPWSTLGKAAGYAGIIAWTLVAVWNLLKNFR